MSAWTVYWLFQLDEIRGMITICAIIIGVVVIIGSVVSLICSGVAKDYMSLPESKKEIALSAKFINKMPFILGVCVLFSALSALLPSTKTMAAIIVLPRIASAENLDTVSKDAGDIYKLAMSRLKEALGEVK